LSLNYKVFGEGDPVIILHGLFGMLDNWQTFAKKLAESHMVFIIDQRDHGKSIHTEEFNYELLSEDLYTFMNEHWIYETKLIGHSMGGKTVMQFAANYPDMIEKMVVVDIAPIAYKPGHQVIFEALYGVDIEKVKSRKEVESVLSNYIDDSGIRQFLMKNLQRNKNTGGFRWKMNLNLLYSAYENIIADVNQPEPIEVETLFVRGQRSKYIGETGEVAIINRYTNGKLVTIADTGHWIHAEKPMELLELVLDFFADK